MTKGDNNEVQIYPNFIYNAAGTGQVSNTGVTTFNSATALLGVTDTPSCVTTRARYSGTRGATR